MSAIRDDLITALGGLIFAYACFRLLAWSDDGDGHGGPFDFGRLLASIFGTAGALIGVFVAVGSVVMAALALR